MASQNREPIAIVGSGCRFPGGSSSPRRLWKLLENPRDVCSEITPDKFNIKGFYHHDGSHHGTTNVSHSYFIQEDIRLFDSAFFNISPNEADSMDPQQRLLLETVYEALEAGGHTLESLRGSDTAVYVGTMGVDYNDTLLRDLDTIPTYFATGTNRAIISNRISYVFDWHGPSMTIDTACSSSLIALHQSVRALRNHESRVALACGTQIILGPEAFIFESKMKMLSPTGRSRMWDADADGYARGEGIAAVVLKRLSDAIADGDHIECVIRETGANQDGFSNGITVPSTEAQAALIRTTYNNAGLDPVNYPYDGPQFFEAHGTGTKAGDPKEAASIAQCFGKRVDTSLYVGSIKTVIGHTEGAAGLAGVLKASGIIQNGLIPPNLLFNKLNPAIAPFYKGLEVPTSLKAWPELPEGVPRRVSVNSFGFGGSNAHAILEQYCPDKSFVADTQESRTVFTPFTFSAASDSSLTGQLEAYAAYLRGRQDINISDLAWTLQSRRSQFPCKIAFSANSLEQLVARIDAKLSNVKSVSGSTLGVRSNKTSVIRVLGVFTGQGAQWPAMGAELVSSSDYVKKRIQDLQHSLNQLPKSDIPKWNLKDELLAGAASSRLSEAALSQPLCTALQIVLVDLLRSAGIEFSAVVGHSSGEIGAAYAAGFLSDRDAIRIAYYRGVYAHLAGNPTRGQKGLMMAVGTSWEDAQELISLRAFAKRIAIAAHNSASSVTLSGDADALQHAKRVFDEEKKFCRMLKVDTAYHSHHMLPCADAYIQALQRSGVKVKSPLNKDCSWFSSVFPSDKPVETSKALQGTYWRDNLVNTVMFADAMKNAVASDSQLSYVLEVGPHPALKGPATQNATEVRPAGIPYSGILSRGTADVEAFSDALGFVWTQFGQSAVNFESYRKRVSGVTSTPKLIVGLPSYSWNHGRVHWYESHKSRKMRGRNAAVHELLGAPSPESTERDRRWTNVLKVSEIPWLDGHQLQGQTVFPAAGYCALAFEAARTLAKEESVQVIELEDLDISRAITFDDKSNSGVETIVTLTALVETESNITADFSCYFIPNSGTDSEAELAASGKVKVLLGNPRADALISAPLSVSNMSDVDVDRFYASLGKLAYGYSDQFRTMSSLKRRLNQASVLVNSFEYPDDVTTTYLVHPTWLDVAFQASMLAYSAPGDERLWSLHVPTFIRKIRINPELCASLPFSAVPIPVSAVLADSDEFSASIDLFTEDGDRTMVQVEDLSIKPFAPASEADDRRLFSYTKLDVLSPHGKSALGDARPSFEEVELGSACERVSYYYCRKWKTEISDEEWTNGQTHHLALRDFMNNTLDSVSRGERPFIKKEWSSDSAEDIKTIIQNYANNVDMKLITAVGENIPAAVRGETTILEHMLPNNMLDDFYKKGLGFAEYNRFLAAMMKQMVHRYPHAKILEIGAGTGGATKAVLDIIGKKMSSYTYTDISVGFFEKAAELFKVYSSKMIFKTLDVEKTPSQQGYEPHTYDIIIASNVLHATASLQKTLENTRQLLKPGGYLMLLELTGNEPIRFSNIMGGLPGWWLGVDDGRKFAPTITPERWHTALSNAGFAGIDAITPEVDHLAWPLSIIASQAVDDRISFLRTPLTSSLSNAPISIDSLVILGNNSLESSSIGAEISNHLGRVCGQITILDGLPTEDEAATLSPMSTFVNLVDLDTPIFKGITAEKMEGLKRLYELAKRILWVTAGAEVDNPYHMASITFNRAMRHEVSHISINHLDFSELTDRVPKTIVESLLRQCALDEWENLDKRQQNQDFMWSREPEIFLEHGLLKIPRLLDNVGQNARLNSSKRIITAAVPTTSNVSVTLSTHLSPALEQQIHPVVAKDGNNLVEISSSSLLALHVATDTFLFVGVGQELNSKETFVTLSTNNSREVAPIAVAPVDDIHYSDRILVTVASQLLASTLLETIQSGSSLMVHCTGKDCFFTSALAHTAKDKAIRLHFTCDAQSIDDTDEPSWIKLDARSPAHVLRRKLARVKPSHFLDLSSINQLQKSELSLGIAQVLPTGIKSINLSDLARANILLSEDVSREELAARLHDAIASAKQVIASGTQSEVEDIAINITQLNDPFTISSVTNVVNWKVDGDVIVQVRPLDAGRLFSKDKSYLLVGLSGQIGQSLCEWMVNNGAGCVCLTSRNPKVDKEWFDSFESTDAIVKVYAMDVTDRQALDKVVEDIRATCPPIAGVANGAMVLHDCLFNGMSAEIMQKVLGPKIDGSNNLDQIFYNEPLDFFLMFSSSACVIGNSGQSNYAAANGYLNSLARQRRARGLAASTFDIGRVAGIGYVETAGQAVVDQLTRFGLMSISETEFLQMFAETIQAGYSVPEDKQGYPNAVVTTGIRTIRDDEEIQGPWLENPLFSHCIIESDATATSEASSTEKNALPAVQQLAAANSREHALKILQDCLSAKLRIVLQLTDGGIDSEIPLVELGVDSLVAVEVRSWFLKELKVDIPVLRIVGGASVSELCQRALEKLPGELLGSAVGRESTNSATSKPKTESASQRKPEPVTQSEPEPLIQTNPKPESVARPKLVHLDASSASLKSSSQSQSSSEVDSIPTRSQMSSAAAPTPITPLSTKASSEDLRDFAKQPKALQPLVTERTGLRFLKSEPLSFGQSRFWFLRLLLEDQTTPNISFYYRIDGDLRIGDLERAVRVVTTRHEALRTCFIEDDKEADQAYQKVLFSSAIRLEHRKVKSVDEVVSEYHKLQNHTFDLSSGVLFRMVLLSISPRVHYFLFNYHHIIMDGVSFQVFLADLEKAYKCEDLGPAPHQFPDYSRIQREAFEKGDMNHELKYWRGVFPPNEQPPVLPLLPMARASSRIAMKSFSVHQATARVTPELMARIKASAKAQRSTPFHFYLAAYKAMLFSFTNARDLTIGIADANRNDSNVARSVGFFLNLLTLRFRNQPDQPFSEAVTEARQASYAALENSHLPFDVLLKELQVERSPHYSPFFQAFFDYRQGAQEEHPWANCHFKFQETHPGRTAYDITLDVTDGATDALVMFRVQKALYDLTAAHLLIDTYLHFLDVLSSDTSQTQKDIPLFAEQQLIQATKIGRGPEMKSSWPETLPLRIDQISQQNQNDIALVDGIGGDLTYSGMTQRIEAIAEELQKLGLGVSSRVLVFQTAASDWVCSMLAIMRIGGIYVPLDLRNPLPRLASVAADCDPSAILVDHTTIADAKELGVPKARVVNVSNVGRQPSQPIENVSRANLPAAILYTSGSTGNPKGIVVTHAGLRNEIEGYTKMWNLGAERTLQQSAFTFNHSSDQIYTGLVNGGTVHIVPWDKRGDPVEISKLLRDNSITYTKATPSEYMMWMRFGGENLRSAHQWRSAFGGGEPMTSIVTSEFANLGLSQLRLYNSYGPTEISISSTKMELDYRNHAAMEDGRIPCGFSLPNYFTYVLDGQLQPVPAGMPGELYIGGAGVSLGYLNNEELTKKHFTSNPFATNEDIANGWDRLYRTGDIGHLQHDGAMVFHNRIVGDSQVKIRGLRIELSDIESNILAAARGALREAVVTLRGGDPELLVAHVVFAPNHNVTDQDAFLERLLGDLPIPQYMIPALAIPLDKLPLTNHSKVDRKLVQTLPLPQRATSSRDDEELAETLVQLKSVWQEVLGNKELGLHIGPSTNFFQVGGNSLLVIRLQARLREVFNVTIRLHDLLGANTLNQMGTKIDESKRIQPINWERETRPPVIPDFLRDIPQAASPDKKTILITGATSFLAKHVLPKLLNDPKIEKIHCIAVRKSTGGPGKLAEYPQLVVHEGDLSAPLLGLSEKEFHDLSSEANLILHLGGVRSFWDNYNILRATNVESVKEIVKLAVPNKAPIHYISTVGALPEGHTDAVSSAFNPPPSDGSNGYVATRWATERILERSVESLGISATIHRFLPTSKPLSPQSILDEFVHFVDAMNKFPDMGGWEGRLDMMPAEEAAEKISRSLLRNKQDGAHFAHHESPVGLDASDLREYLEQERGGKGLDRIPVLRWFGRIKQLGFNQFPTAQDVTVDLKVGGTSSRYRSRR